MKPDGMTRSLVAPAALCLLVACGERAAEAPAEVAAGATLVELEGRFAAASRAQGAKAAFLEFLAEDSIVLQPGPVWGRAAWEAMPDRPGTLDWAPDRAQLAADGRFGYASGPWTLADADGKRVAEGRYVTVWRKSGEEWKVVFDGGLPRAPTAMTLPQAHARLDAAHCTGDPAAKGGDLQLLDLGLAGAADGDGYAARLRQLAAPGLALFHPPNAEGAESAGALDAALAALPATTQLLPMGAGVATSGDLGYTYGLAAPGPGASADAAYVHVWCRGTDGWRLLLELRAPLPAPKAG